MNNKLEERKLVFKNQLIQNTDEFIIDLLSKIKKQLLITDPAFNSFILKYLHFVKKDVQIFIVLPSSCYDKNRIDYYSQIGVKANYLIDDEIKDNFLIIDKEKTYILGVATNTGEETLIIQKFIDPYIGDIILKKYHLKKSVNYIRVAGSNCGL